MDNSREVPFREWKRPLVERPKVERPKVAMVLSGGAARGLAHLGVLSVLQEHGIPIDLIVAASYGSIVGGYFAYGYTPGHMAQMCKEFRIGAVLNLKRLWKSLYDGEKLVALLRNDLGEVRIEELTTPLSILALDITKGDAVIFDRGPLLTALRASTALPGLFVPLPLDGHCYVDGGMLWEILIETARKKGADIVIFSDASFISLLRGNRWFRKFYPALVNRTRTWSSARFFSRRVSSGAGSLVGAVHPLALLLRVFSLAERIRLANGGFPGVKADFTLSPVDREMKPLGFRQVDLAVELGRNAALNALPDIRKALKGDRDCT